MWRALTFRELPGATGIASIEACIRKLRLVEKYIKYQDTRGQNVNVSWFGVTRTPEDAPNTAEDAPVVFWSTFRELPGATIIASIGAGIQKLRFAEKYIKYQDTRGQNVNVSWFGVTSTPEDAPTVFCSTFRELPGATEITSVRARIQKLRLAEKYIRYQDTHADEM